MSKQLARSVLQAQLVVDAQVHGAGEAPQVDAFQLARNIQLIQANGLERTDLDAVVVTLDRAQRVASKSPGGKTAGDRQLAAAVEGAKALKMLFDTGTVRQWEAGIRADPEFAERFESWDQTRARLWSNANGLR